MTGFHIPPTSSSAPDPLAPRPWPQRETPLEGQRAALLARSTRVAFACGEELAEAGAEVLSFDCPMALATHLGSTDCELVVMQANNLSGEEVEAVLTVLGNSVLVLIGNTDHTSMNRRAYDRVDLLARDGELVSIVLHALEQHGLEEENRGLRELLEGRSSLGRLTTRDPALSRVLSMAETVAPTRANVLITGESGTGKTILAEALHLHSTRAGQPFVVVHCGALPESLLESELFGHVKGAFTGATHDRAGRFEEADGGTIFLDEIQSAPLSLQVKLLRIIQDRRFERVGDSRTREVDVRIITATNRDLPTEVAHGRFREDLFYRLHVVTLELPPLRERPGDVVLLAEAALSRFATTYDKPIEGISSEALTRLIEHDWPGNVRELENVIERAALLTQDPYLHTEDLALVGAATFGPTTGLTGSPPAPLPTGAHPPRLSLGIAGLTEITSLREALEVPEQRIIEHILAQCGGRRKEAAERLGINRATLFNKMRKYDLLEKVYESTEE